VSYLIINDYEFENKHIAVVTRTEINIRLRVIESSYYTLKHKELAVRFMRFFFSQKLNTIKTQRRSDVCSSSWFVSDNIQWMDDYIWYSGVPGKI